MVTAHSTRRQSLLLLAAATAAIPAAAQERTPELRGEAQDTASAGATRPVRLAIDGLTPGLQVRVEPRSERVPEGAAKAAVCAEDCELELQKGTYTLIASRGDEHRTKEVELTSSQLLRVGQWDGVARTTGIVMGITGLVVGAIGAFITVGSFVAPSPGPDDEDLDNTGTKVLFVGMAGLAAGTGLAIGGFSLAAGNRAPSMDLERMPTSRPPAPGPGAGISLGGKF